MFRKTANQKISIVSLTNATASDSGNYTCSIGKGAATSIQVDVEGKQLFRNTFQFQNAFVDSCPCQIEHTVKVDILNINANVSSSKIHFVLLVKNFKTRHITW